MAQSPRPTPVALQDAPDALLAARAADGDRRAFAVVVQRYGRLLRGYATRVLGGPSSSDDVVQEVFLTAWQQLDRLEEPAALRSWLIRITTRTALHHARAERPHDDLDEVDVAVPEDAEPDRLVHAASLSSALRDSLDRLPDIQRRAWVLKELGGYRYDEIADELDLPPSTVRGALARARRSLITDLDGWRQP